MPQRARYYERETYAGDPARATAALGEEYVARLSEVTAAALLELWEGRIGLDECFSPLWPLRRLLLSDLGYSLFARVASLRPSPI